ncbi:MAG: TIM barrel protein [Bacillota bacterium]|uniref:TIM barrel protein n=1 Tax=Desulforudis sp. DRI-14 TaxID=3459793 RepID=UPI00346DB3EB
MGMIFGPAGNSDSFYVQGYKSSVDAPGWLRAMGLGAYEYQCVRGVNIGEATAAAIGEAAARHNVALSIHAPYYINLASENPEHVVKSKRHLLQSVRAARWMGATRVVFHPGSAGRDRKAALDRAIKVLAEVVDEARSEELDDIFICPETLGKYSYLGLLDEVLAMCSVDERMFPAIDFGHIHAITRGSLTTKEAYAAVLDRCVEVLGEKRVRKIHIHFSPIEFTAAGERRHRTLRDEGFGPDFVPLAGLIIERGYSPILICESNGTQAEDARHYQEIYQRLRKAQSPNNYFLFPAISV